MNETPTARRASTTPKATISSAGESVPAVEVAATGPAAASRGFAGFGTGFGVATGRFTGFCTFACTTGAGGGGGAT